MVKNQGLGHEEVMAKRSRRETDSRSSKKTERVGLKEKEEAPERTGPRKPRQENLKMKG